MTGVVTGFRNGDDDSVISGLAYSTTATTGSDVGTYDINGSGATATNYIFGFDSGTLTVDPALLSVTANDASREFGLANPTLTGVVTGFRNGDDDSVISGLIYDTTANTQSLPGDFDILASGASATNYVFDFTSGTLTVRAEATEDSIHEVVTPQVSKENSEGSLIKFVGFGTLNDNGTQKSSVDDEDCQSGSGQGECSGTAR